MNELGECAKSGVEESLSRQGHYPAPTEHSFEFTITAGQQSERLDTFLTREIRNATRTRIQQAIDLGAVSVNGITSKASRKIQPKDHVVCKVMKRPPITLIPENISLDIRYEDEFLMIVNKPAGMVTHPGFGNRFGTLVNAVLYHLGQRQAITVEDESDEETEGEIFAGDDIRPGIVHRLDKETSGVLVVAKKPEIHTALQQQFHAKTAQREYYALIWGDLPESSGAIEGDIGRSTRDRKLMAVVRKGGKQATTTYQVLERFDFTSLVRFKLLTGRTHQIRVHCANLGHPLVGDFAYGGDEKAIAGWLPDKKRRAKKVLSLIARQALHAKTLGFQHPVSKDWISVESELPNDFECVLTHLREHQQ